MPLTSSTDTTNVLLEASTEKLLFTFTAMPEPLVIAGSEATPRSASAEGAIEYSESVSPVTSNPINVAKSTWACLSTSPSPSVSTPVGEPVVALYAGTEKSTETSEVSPVEPDEKEKVC